MSDIYINATKLETKLREDYDIAIAYGYYDLAKSYEQLIDILKSQPRFQRIDVMERSIVDNADITCIPENDVMDMAKENLSHDLGEYAVKNEYARITSHRGPMFNNSIMLELYASFLIPEQPEQLEQRSMISTIGDDEDEVD